MKKANAVDYLFLLRPSIQAALWTFYMAGIYLKMRETAELSFFAFRIGGGAALGLLGYSLMMGSVYVLNQIRDIDTDRINNKLFLLSEGIISARSAYIFAAACALAGFGIFLSPPLFGINKIILASVSFIMGLMYTIKPFECKRRPFADLLLNGAGYGVIAPLLGYTFAGGELNFSAVIKTVPYALSMSAVFINTTLMDYEGDKAVGAKTTGVFLGIRKSLALSFLLMLFAAAAGWAVRDIIVMSCAIYSLIPFGAALIMKSPKSIESSVKYSSPVMTLAFGILFPEFLLLSIIALASIFVYYRFRFGRRGF